MEIKGINEECGIAGIFGLDHASERVYYSLHAMQHRGQESAGIVSCFEGIQKYIKGPGLVTEVLNEQNIVSLKGRSAIGHVRYSSSSGNENIQPFLFRHHLGDFSLCHNGNIVNSLDIRKALEKSGSIFQSMSDAEIVAHLMKKENKGTILESIQNALRVIEGAFAIVILTKDKLFACRDKHGLRPLSLGKIDDGYVVASETCAFNTINATYIRDLKPGEILEISSDGLVESSYSDFSHHHMCAMEYIYFSRPDSDIENINVHSFRKISGKFLAQVAPVEADIVVGVPDSSLSAAIGYAEESKIPYETGLLKNKYIGRTFIQPSQALREKSVMMKLSVINDVIKNKRIVLIDDSIVRGTTSKRIVKMLKNAGAKEVHVRIASPTFQYPCIYGVDINTYEELISSRKDVEGVRKEIGADSLAFLDIDHLYKAAKNNGLCVACFSGKYPTNMYGLLKDANKENKF